MSALPFDSTLVSSRTLSPSTERIELRAAVMGHAVRAVAAMVALQVYLAGGLSLRITLLSLVDGVWLGLLAPVIALALDRRGFLARAVVTTWNALGMLSLCTLCVWAAELARDYPRDVQAFSAPSHVILLSALVLFLATSHVWVALRKV